MLAECKLVSESMPHSSGAAESRGLLDDALIDSFVAAMSSLVGDMLSELVSDCDAYRREYLDVTSSSSFDEEPREDVSSGDRICFDLARYTSSWSKPSLSSSEGTLFIVCGSLINTEAVSGC